MSLKEQIQKDFIEAFKAKDAVKSSALKMLQAEIKNTEIKKQNPLDDGEVVQVAAKEAKKRKDAMEIYEKENRKEMYENEKAEFEILSRYLPEQMKEEEIRKLVKDAIGKTSALSAEDIGKVMGVLMPQVRGKADGSLVNKIVKESLSS